MMEWWNIGVMGEAQYSKIPEFQFSRFHHSGRIGPVGCFLNPYHEIASTVKEIKAIAWNPRS